LTVRADGLEGITPVALGAAGFTSALTVHEQDNFKALFEAIEREQARRGNL